MFFSLRSLLCVFGFCIALRPSLHACHPICYVECPMHEKQYVFSIYAYFDDGMCYRFTRQPHIDAHSIDFFLSKKKEKIEMIDSRSIQIETWYVPLSGLRKIAQSVNSILPTKISWPPFLAFHKHRYQLAQDADLMQVFWLCYLYGRELRLGETIADDSSVERSMYVPGSDFLKKAKWKTLTGALSLFYICDMNIDSFFLRNKKRIMPLFVWKKRVHY